MAALLLLATAIMGSPGPTTVSLVGVASAFGPRRAVPYMLGEITGTTIVLLAVATGITATLLAIPALAGALTVVSGLYIVWLAYRIATAPPLRAVEDPAAAVPPLAGGMLLGVANPKAWVAIAAVFANGRLANFPLVDAILKVVVLTGMIVVIHLAWLLAGASLAPLLRHPHWSRVINVVLALALLVATIPVVLP